MELSEGKCIISWLLNQDHFKSSVFTSYQVNGPHPVSFVIHAGCLFELGLQLSDLLLEFIPLMFTLHSLFLYVLRRIMFKMVKD